MEGNSLALVLLMGYHLRIRPVILDKGENRCLTKEEFSSKYGEEKLKQTVYEGTVFYVKFPNGKNSHELRRDGVLHDPFSRETEDLEHLCILDHQDLHMGSSSPDDCFVGLPILASGQDCISIEIDEVGDIARTCAEKAAFIQKEVSKLGYTNLGKPALCCIAIPFID